MSTTKWMIVKNPNMREEQFLSGYAPIDWSFNDEDAMTFGLSAANRISRLLLEMCISHELRQTY